MKINSPNDAIRVLRSAGWSVRLATVAEKLTVARRAKCSRGHPYRASCCIHDHEVQDSFCKPCFVIFEPRYTGGGGDILSASRLIKLVRGLSSHDRARRPRYVPPIELDYDDEYYLPCVKSPRLAA